MNCPCGSLLPYADCCEPYHRSKRQPLTAEALMRARYSAYAQGEVDFVLTTQEAESGEADRQATEAWAKESQWLGLEILKTEAGGASDKEGTVEFRARYKFQGEEHQHHEQATFRRNGERWLLVDSKMVNSTFRRTQPKIGPNEPCPCGSGKKFKKCCATK